MRALTVQPGVAGSLAVEDVEDPRPGPGELLVDGLAVGICGTDKEIAAGEYGWAPPGAQRLVLGHESLGRVREAPAGSGFDPGDLVVGVVRRPDPVPCGACAHGAFDMCRNGEYTERGIKQLHGYASQSWSLAPDYAVRLSPDLGATYHCEGFDAAVAGGRPDVVIEATGAAPLVLDAMETTAAYGIVCLTGVSTPGRSVSVDAGALNRSIVLENDVVFGSVNANLRHYGLAAEALAAGDPGGLARLTSRRVPLESFAEAFEERDGDVKVVLVLQ
jgi:threonine dehydrogenase-like Zn-dependent dehydrogenase